MSYHNDFDEIENVFIPINRDCHLSARIWLPKQAENKPVPAILEYLPYRKRDGTAERDQLNHPYLAAHGYACLRVDMRGSGEADGILLDEYLPQEQNDCLHVLRWIASQPWCNGKIGMMGISWGGFNALQVAALRPPELQAIISLCSTDDRYGDDIHYMDGCLLNDNLQWSTMMLAMMSRPPDKLLVGERWRDMWIHRLQQQPLLISTWLRHPHRDDYWKHGSICENWESIQCPVYLIGGWFDGYASAIPRMLAHLTCPRKGLIGPWAHKYPHFATPAPRIGFLQEALRWFDYWLKGIDTHIMAEPLFRVWMEESFYPDTHCAVKPGRWIAESAWPSPNITPYHLYLNTDKQLAAQTQTHTCFDIITPQSVGASAGAWCGYGIGPERPGDQQCDDTFSLCFETAPLTEKLEILGAATLVLELEVDKPLAFVAVRLNEVMPNGSVARISYGLLNLTHRHGHEHSVAATGRMFVTVTLNDIAHAFNINHRIRIAISTTYWPLVFPSPEPVKLRVFTHHSRLSLPVRTPRESDHSLRPFAEPVTATPMTITYLRPPLGKRYSECDATTGLINYYIEEDYGHCLLDSIGLETEFKQSERYQIDNTNPLAAAISIHYTVKTGRAEWQTRSEIHCHMHADKTHFHIHAELHAYEKENLLLSRKWSDSIKRDGV